MIQVQYGTTVQLTNLAPSSAYSVSIEARNKYTLLNESGSDDLRGPVMLYEPNRDSISESDLCVHYYSNSSTSIIQLSASL